MQTSQSGEQVRIQLSTRHVDLEFPEPTGPILVSTGLKRYALSTLVNTLLGESKPTAQAIPFQFLINGHFLRGSLSDFLTQQGISAESTLNVEYLRAQRPPTYQSSFQHDDWVGAVDVLSNSSPAIAAAGEDASNGIIAPGQERILSGCYDGVLRIWNPSGQIIASSPPMTEPQPNGSSKNTHQNTSQCIYAAKFLSPTRIVSGGFGAPICIWSYEHDSATTQTMTESHTKIHPIANLKGHTGTLGPFDSIAVHPSTSRILTASDDATINLWRVPLDLSSSSTLSQSTPTSNHLNKKRRLHTSHHNLPSLTPTASFAQHTRPATSAIFHPTQPTDALYSTSTDRTLRTWDIETESCVSTRTPAPDTPLSSLVALKSLSLLAAGTADRRIVLVDPRDDARKSAVGVLRGAGGEVVGLAAEPGESEGEGRGYGLVSASYDGVVRVWDVRNTSAATYKVPRQSVLGQVANAAANGGSIGKTAGKKLFSVVWDADVGIVSGGEDGAVQVNSTP